MTLYPHDTQHASREGMRVPTHQIQLEQDTGKAIASVNVLLVDSTRVGAGLIEITTAPFDVPGVEFASAVMKQLQATLHAVEACVVGMEWGNLRADMNVSACPKGVQALRERCEIKNLSSLKLVEEAITAEIERQAGILEDGGTVKGRREGWIIGICWIRV